MRAYEVVIRSYSNFIGMYRSILTLNTESGSARRDLRWPYEFHRTLARCRANSGLPEETKVLFCYDGDDRVIVQSPAKIEFWSGITHDYAYRIETEVVKLPKTGDTIEFQLTANLVAKKSRSNYRYPIHGKAEQLQWLARQGMNKGFSIVYAEVVNVYWAGYKDETTDKADLPVFCATFRGVLMVTDAEEFAKGVEVGIGRGKMHGLGLLQYRIINPSNKRSLS